MLKKTGNSMGRKIAYKLTIAIRRHESAMDTHVFTKTTKIL